jgi:hypothetical protein
MIYIHVIQLLHKMKIKQKVSAQPLSGFVRILATDENSSKTHFPWFHFVHTRQPYQRTLRLPQYFSLPLTCQGISRSKDNVCKQQYTSYSIVHTKRKQCFRTKASFYLTMSHIHLQLEAYENVNLHFKTLTNNKYGK